MLRAGAVAVLLCACGVAAKSASRFPLQPSSRGLLPTDCTHATFESAVQKAMDGTDAAAEAHHRKLGGKGGDEGKFTRDKAVQHVFSYCGGSNGVCPAAKHIDVQSECSMSAVHSFAWEFDHAVHKRHGLMCQILFLVAALICGAVSARSPHLSPCHH